MVTEPRSKTGIELVLKQFGSREGRRFAGPLIWAGRSGGYFGFQRWSERCRCLAVAHRDQRRHETGECYHAGDREGRAEARGQGAVHGRVGEWGYRELIPGHRGGDGAHDRDSERPPELATDVQKGR